MTARFRPEVRPFRRWRRRALVLAILASITGLYEFEVWLGAGHVWTYPEQNQRRLDRLAGEAVDWMLLHPGHCPTVGDLGLDIDEGRDMFGTTISFTCDDHGAILVHSAGHDCVFGTPDDQISGRSLLTVREPP